MWLFLIHDLASRRIAQEEAENASTGRDRVAEVMWPDSQSCPSCSRRNETNDVSNLNVTNSVLLWDRSSVIAYLNEAYWSSEWRPSAIEDLSHVFHLKDLDVKSRHMTVVSRLGNICLAFVCILASLIALSELVGLLSGRSIAVRLFGHMKHSISCDSELDVSDLEIGDNKLKPSIGSISKRLSVKY